MKRIILLLLTFFSLAAFTRSGGPIADDCTCKGVKLFGKVKIVDSFSDFDIQVVDSFEDIRVEIVRSFPDQCGKWQIVESFPDFKVRFVRSFPDFKIKYVSSFPGIK